MKNYPAATVCRKASRPRPLTAAAAFLLSCFLLGMLLTPLLELPALWREEHSTSDSKPVEFHLLREEQWSALSPDARLEVLKGVAAAEAEVLGLPFPVNVKMDALEARVRGTYRHRARQITLNQTFVCTGTASEVVETLAHELYHAYQHCIVDLYLKNESYQNLKLFTDVNAKEYCHELAKYQDGLDGEFEAYYRQQIERDARAYAQKIRDAYERIYCRG